MIITSLALILFNQNQYKTTPPTPNTQQNKSYIINPTSQTPELVPEEAMTFNIYFGNNIIDDDIDCSKVYAVPRTVAKNPAIAKTALTELIKGPTSEELKEGYFTSINTDTVVQSIKIDKEVAYVDFNSALQKDVAGSCKVLNIKAQITNSLYQFETVKEVVISVDGEIEDVLQP